MSRAAKRAFEGAVDAALRLGHARLDAVHVVIALFDPKNEASGEIGGAHGVDFDALAARADALYEGPRGKPRQRDIEWGEWREVMELARDEAETAGVHDIAPAHLFLAATADDSWTATRALRELGHDVEALRKEVAKAYDALDRAE